MWLSQGLRRGCVRMRKIFSGGRTTTSWHRASYRSIDQYPSNDDFIKPISQDVLIRLRHRREEVYTTTGKHLISRSPIPKINDG